MAALATTLSIRIEHLTFVLISKSVADNKGYVYVIDSTKGVIEERNKIIFEVYDDKGINLGVYNAYSSVSELGIWRLCFVSKDDIQHIEKFDNYIQATLLDVRLQAFINENFHLLPFVTKADASGTQLILTKAQLASDPDKEIYTYLDGVNPNGIITCPVTTTESYEINKRDIQIFRPTLITLQQKSDFLEDNYNLITESYSKITDYNIKLDNFHAHVDLYEITAVKKERGETFLPDSIIFQIGKCSFDVLHHDIHREGYYIFNIKLPETTILKYGIYNNFVSGITNNNDENYITKPLNYIKQPVADNYAQTVRDIDTTIENIKSKHYIFTAHRNIIQFPIKQIIQFNTLTRQFLDGGRKSKRKRNHRKSNRRKSIRKKHKSKRI